MSERAPQDARRAHVLVLDNITPEQREQIHEVVKENSAGWWHHFADSWIVLSSRTSEEWRDLLTPIIPVGAGVVVLRVDRDSPETWAVRFPGAKEKSGWLHRYLKNEQAT